MMGEGAVPPAPQLATVLPSKTRRCAALHKRIGNSMDSTESNKSMDSNLSILPGRTVILSPAKVSWK